MGSIHSYQLTLLSFVSHSNVLYDFTIVGSLSYVIIQEPINSQGMKGWDPKAELWEGGSWLSHPEGDC